MNETPSPLVNTDMPTLPALYSEKHQVSGTQATYRNRARILQLLRRGSRNGNPDAAMHELNQPAAIEAPTVCATVAIRNTELIHGLEQ